MIITRISVAAHELPLTVPLITAHGPLPTRPVLLVALWDARGHVAVGEAAPLPTHGTESFDLAHSALMRLAARTEFPELAPDLAAFGPWLSALGLARDFAPASCWALECALATLAAGEQKQSLAQWLGADMAAVQVNALPGGADGEAVLQAASRAVAAGYRTLKIKLGVAPLRAGIDLVRRLREVLPLTALRLDANAALSFDEARQLAHAVTSSAVEYIEEPLANPTPETLRLLRAAVRVPLALDESLGDDERFAEAVAQRLCDVVVLKPAAVGSLAVLFERLRMARQAQIATVISNLIESSIGLGYAAHVAAAGGGSRYAHGLGTAALLATDTLTDARPLTRGELPLTDPRDYPRRLHPALAQTLNIPAP